MTDLTRVFGGPWSPPTAKPIDDQIRDAMFQAGVTPPDRIILDGNLHRFATGSKGQGGHDKPGWYVFYPDGVCAGAFGDWRSGVSQNFRAEVGRELTPQEQMAVMRRQREAREARDAKAAQAAETVDVIWSQAGAASDDHPYLARKKVKAHGLRITGDGRLMAPLFDEAGALSSLQYIDADGNKLYHAGGTTGGRYWTIGAVEGDLIYIAEGFATAATIHEVTGKPCVVAYSASNLVPVTGHITAAHPQARVVIVADNDASGTGQKYADQASAKHNASVIVIPITGDANDYVSAGHDLAALLSPPIYDWLIPADDFASQPAPIEWLVKGWLQAKALIMVHGPSGGGKTFAVLDWVLHMAAGLAEWNGYKIKPGAVAYLAGEGHHGLRGRIAAWKQKRGVLRLSMWLSQSGVDLNTPSGLKATIEHLRSLPVAPIIIVVDTLHRFLRGDENSAQDAKTMLDACAKLIEEFGCAVVLVHHTGVNEDAQHRARGSSAWRGALDIEISVVPGDGGRLQLVQRKSKDAELKPPINAQLTSIAIEGWVDEDGDPVTSAVIEVTGESLVSESEGGKANKLHHHQKTMSRAWEAGGSQWIDSTPFVARSALQSLLEADGYKAGAIKNMLAPGSEGKLIHALTNADWIKSTGQDGEKVGWVIIEPGWASALALIVKNQGVDD